MASSNATVQVASFDVPVGVNPYAWVQAQLLAQMYPPWASGFHVRFIVLLVVLAAVIILSFLYLALYTTETRRKGREWWAWRVIERPAGRYLIINQYVGYPICSIALGAMWIGYTCWIYQMFGGAHADPSPLFYFYPFCWIPFFISMSITTFAVLSGANLASKGRAPNSHRLSPFIANTLLLGLPLCMVVAISVAGIWSGRKWQIFAHSWTAAYDALGVAASEWNGTFDEATKAEMLGGLGADFSGSRLERYFEFRSSQYISTVIYCLSASILIVINLTGGLYLLATLRALGGQHRVVPRNEPLVAPLQPFATGPSALDTTGASPTPNSPISFENKDSRSSSAWEKMSASAGLKRLEWDVTLFFIAVVPACVLFMGFSIFMANNLTVVLTTPSLYEFAFMGIIFIYACITFLSLLALTIKTALSVYSSRSRGSARLGDDTVEANLRRRRAQGKAGPAGAGGVGVVVCEWKEIESVYEEPWTGQSTTRGSLYPRDMHPGSFVGGEDTL
ncbi:hypothetical protein BCR35DRAFT_270681 [Leucosporidium creatinivorum]|uniref:Proteophosphoglycan ppg4 n=1 Tax=Leucosporidium creatinivorum TaxID=106004 RepID=A0A1Y2DTZ0_9BASI|nr:hypothetical protein BCR35DRAFT_270681 [Leucosporidium creatinivorum]